MYGDPTGSLSPCPTQEMYDEYVQALRRPGTPVKTFRIKVFLFPALQDELDTEAEARCVCRLWFDALQVFLLGLNVSRARGAAGAAFLPQPQGACALHSPPCAAHQPARLGGHGRFVLRLSGHLAQSLLRFGWDPRQRAGPTAAHTRHACLSAMPNRHARMRMPSTHAPACILYALPTCTRHAWLQGAGIPRLA